MLLILVVFHRNCRKLNELSGQSIISLWDALWLGIGSFLWFSHEAFKHKKQTLLVGSSYCRRFQIVENSITFPMNRSRASGWFLSCNL